MTEGTIDIIASADGEELAVVSVDDGNMEFVESFKTLRTCFDRLYTWKKGELPKPVTNFFEWGLALSNEENRIVEQTEIGHYFISTVFLGLDHNFNRLCSTKDILFEAVLFETMVFADGSAIELDVMRYQTEDKAREGHAYAVDIIRSREKARLISESKKIKRIR